MTECCKLCFHCANETLSRLIWFVIWIPTDIAHQSKMPTLDEKYWKTVLSEVFFFSSEICVLPLCNQLWRNPDICCHSCHLLDRTSFAAPLHGILVAIFLARYKGHSRLDFRVCVCAHVYVFKVVLLPLREIDQCYLYKVWKLINSVVRRKKKKVKYIAVLTKNIFKVKQCRLRY